MPLRRVTSSTIRSGAVSPTTADHVRSSLPGVFVLDGGPCRAGIESTVVSLVGEARVLRRGVIGAERIARTLGRSVREGLASDGSDDRRHGGTPLESPGMLHRHYAPTARAILVEAASVERSAAAAGGSAVVVAREWSGAGVRAVIRMPMDAEAYAARLYAALREADELAGEVGIIIIERPPEAGDIWPAVLDRLTRACA